MHKKTPWKTVKMAPIYDFPRAARAEHTATAPKKCLPESVFSGRTPKTTFASAGRTNLVAGSPFQSLLSPSCYFLSAQRLCDDVKIVAKIRWGLEEVSLYQGFTVEVNLKEFSPLVASRSLLPPPARPAPLIGLADGQTEHRRAQHVAT